MVNTTDNVFKYISSDLENGIQNPLSLLVANSRSRRGIYEERLGLPMMDASGSSWV